MFDPVRICTILNEEGVEYVVVGGFAAVVHGRRCLLDIDGREAATLIARASSQADERVDPHIR
jgi:hypothetical protein